MQNGIEPLDFLSGISVGNSSDPGYPEQLTNVKSKTLSLVPGLSARAATASGSAQELMSTSCPSVPMAWAATGFWSCKSHKGARSPHRIRQY